MFLARIFLALVTVRGALITYGLGERVLVGAGEEAEPGACCGGL